ncbi:MAG TPA: PAS domain S-box protein [Verrucomicrobiales bacterium]|nr:PAS domain S-box protein [Verrucomicrobiales bacterium]
METNDSNQNQNDFQLFIEEASDGMGITDREFLFVKVNPALCRMLGYQETELLGLNAEVVFNAEELAETHLKRQELLEVQTLCNERMLVRKDGSRFPAEISSKLVGGNRILAIVGDISDRKEAELALHDSEHSYRSLVNTIDGIVWEADPKNFEFTFVSKQAEKILGYPIEQWLTQKSFWIDHLHPEDRVWAPEKCITDTESGKDHSLEYTLTHQVFGFKPRNSPQT